jgi:type I restriction enzyme M protein
MAIHGDGWNNIHRSNVFQFKNSPLSDWHGKVDVILANPPFSLTITDKDILQMYELGRGKDSQISDVLFLERCYKLLRNGGRLLIVLPKGWTNNPTAQWLRDWIYQNWIEVATISLPEGIFKPFGESGATTVILYLRKPLDAKDKQGDVAKINIQFVGYDHHSKKYKKINQNDLSKVIQTEEFQDFLQSLRIIRERDSRFKELRKLVAI